MVAVLGSLLRQRRSPGSTVAWVLVIMLAPPIGLPLYLLFGGRKLRVISATKAKIELKPEAPRPADGWAPIGESLLGSYGLAPPAAGNSIHFHANGEEAFADLINLIDSAQHSIGIQTYEMMNDDAGKVIMEHLAAQAKKGVKVRLLLDGLGAFRMSLWALWKLRRAGASTAFFLPVWRIALISRSNLRNHRKIAVFDDARVFAGGRNLTTNYLGPQPAPKRWRDLSFVLEGPSVADFAKIFRYDWAFTTHEQIPPATQPAPAGNSGARGAGCRGGTRCGGRSALCGDHVVALPGAEARLDRDTLLRAGRPHDPGSNHRGQARRGRAHRRAGQIGPMDHRSGARSLPARCEGGGR